MIEVMNIAILTQPICNNYGGILQNYALQTLLERRGHSVITLNYPVMGGYTGSPIRHGLSICKRVLQKIAGHPEIVWVDLGKESRKQVELASLQRVFIDKYLHLHDIQSPITWEQVIDFQFDAFVVGSDQVWRPRYNRGHIGNLFLDFAEGQNVKRISYAASFGADVWEMNHEETESCSRLVKSFDAVSVRELSGVSLCKDNFGVDAAHVLDPTLMLDAEDYLSLCSGNEHPEGDYIAVYTLDYTKEKLAVLLDISRQLDLPLHLIGRFTKSGYPSMESWIEGIAYAKYVITDSFHGTVFSTIFHKQFVTLGNVVRGNSRFASLFTTLGIPDNRLCGIPTKIVPLLQQHIEYDGIDKLKSVMQQVSGAFLAGVEL